MDFSNGLKDKLVQLTLQLIIKRKGRINKNVKMAKKNYDNFLFFTVNFDSNRLGHMFCDGKTQIEMNDIYI